MNTHNRSWRWIRGVGVAVGAIAASGYLLGRGVRTWDVADRVYVRVGSGELALGRHEPPMTVFDFSVELPWDPKPTEPVVWRRPGASAEWEAALPFWSITLIGAAITAYAWHRCRTRPGHCPNCGYDLAGITQGVCPECGTISRQPEGTNAALKS